MRDVNRRSVLVACVLVLLALAIAVHATAVGGWWLNDDPALLVEAIRQPALSVLFNPAEYGHLSTNTFTPLLLLSYKLDLLVHGLDPSVFYEHQIASMIVAGLLFFFLLRRFVADLYAAAGAGVFLTSWISVYTVRTLMIRHYLEGLLFALGALLAWSYGRRGLIVGSLLYLLAMLSKEIYAPIPLFLICEEWAAGRTWREIARDLVPPALAAAVFLGWRWAMTGLTGGYAQEALHGEFAPLRIALWRGVTGPAPLWEQVVWAICIVLAFGAFLIRKGFRGALFLAATAIVIVLPLAPVLHRFEVRYAFGIVAFGIGALTIAAGKIERRWAMAIPAVLLITTIVNAFPQRTFYESLTRCGMEQEGRYVWERPPQASVLFATSPGWYLESLALLRTYDHRGNAPRFVFSQYAITAGGVNPNAAVGISSSGRPVPVAFCTQFGTPAEWERERRLCDPAAPLSIDFALRDHVAQWNLGPPGGQFVFLTDPEYAAIGLPPAGKQRVPEAREKQYFRILRKGADGRWTVSPTLPVPDEGDTTRWQRKKFEVRSSN